MTSAFILLHLIAAADTRTDPVDMLKITNFDGHVLSPEEIAVAIACARERGFVSLTNPVTVTPAGYAWAHDLLAPLSQLATPRPRVSGRRFRPADQPLPGQSSFLEGINP